MSAIIMGKYLQILDQSEESKLSRGNLLSEKQ